MTLRQRYDNTILSTYSPPPPVFVRGAGSRVWCEDGKEYIDFGGGIAVLSLGHCHPKLSAVIGEQAQQLMHMSNLYVNAPAVELATLLTEQTFAERVFLCNSGAEANEAALKLARRFGVSINPDKYRVLSFNNGFHGRVGLSLAATPKACDGFGPLAAGFDFAPYNDLAVTAALINDKTCAVIVEPVQGEGGVHIATPEFLRGLRKLADDHQAMLIYDEIQIGNGRSGALYDYMNGDVVPDMLTTAKGLGGGFPVAAMLAGCAATEVLAPGTHGTTYGGNALAARSAFVVLETLLKEGFLAGVRERAAVFAEHLHRLQEETGSFADIRQRGLLIGAQLNSDWDAAKIARAALDVGLLVITAGGNTLRFAPALNIPFADINEGFARLAPVLLSAKD